MNHKFILILCILFGLSLYANPPLSNRPNPVAFGINLFNQTSVKEAEEVCKYYHLNQESTSNNKCIYRTGDGSTLTFSKIDSGDIQVKVITSMSKKEIEKVLEECQFVRVKDNKTLSKFKGMNVYMKGTQFAYSRTLCIFGNETPLTLTFLKDKK